MSAPDVPSTDRPGGVGFWIGAVIGIGIMAFGLRGLFMDVDTTQRIEFGKWFVGADLLHDLVLAPAIVVVSVVLTRLLPRRWQPPVRAGCIASAIVFAVAWAPLRGYGRVTAAGNPTVQPLNYATAVLTVLAVVWGIVAVWLAVGSWRRRVGARPGTGTAGVRNG